MQSNFHSPSIHSLKKNLWKEPTYLRWWRCCIDCNPTIRKVEFEHACFFKSNHKNIWNITITLVVILLIYIKFFVQSQFFPNDYIYFVTTNYLRVRTLQICLFEATITAKALVWNKLNKTKRLLLFVLYVCLVLPSL